jgi:hypothetical protein
LLQVTKFELAKQAKQEQERSRQAYIAQEMEKRREVDENTYAQLVDLQTDNSLDGVEARNVDQALSQLGLEECDSLPIQMTAPCSAV